MTNYVTEHEYPYLAQLIGCWFHQDFDIAGNTIEAVIASFKKLTTPADSAETRADIARLLSRYDDTALPQEFVRLFRPDVTVEGLGRHEHAAMARARRRVAAVI